jgi:hypothetical protein
MTQAAPATTAPRAIDIASAVKESLTHSQIVKVESQSAPMPQWHFQETETGPLDGVAHGANHFTGNASHRKRQDEEEADNSERQRGGS